jgi:uncharacterized membrane protein (GlpM family)
MSSWKEYLLYFFIGGAVTTVIVALEENGSRLLSGFATLIPVFTLVAYFFIGESRGGLAVSQHAWFVLIGTIVSWIPYMLVVALLASRIGSQKAIVIGLGVFFLCAFAYLAVIDRYGLFR